jgi:hypothetical protein
VSTANPSKHAVLLGFAALATSLRRLRGPFQIKEPLRIARCLHRPMTAIINPYRLEQRLHWRNRVAQWRAQPGESAFHALAWAVLLVAAGVLLWQSWPRLIEVVDMAILRWPSALLLVAMLTLTQWQALAVQTQRQRWARHWLIAQPIAESRRRRVLIEQTLIRAGLQMLAGVVVLSGTRSAAPNVSIWIGLVLLAAALGWQGARRTARRDTAAMPRTAVWLASGPGSLLRWQISAALASLAPRSMSRLLWLLLLVPTGDWTAFMLAAVVLALGIAVAAWSRMLAVLPAAQAWLAPQPLPPRRLLLGCVGLPLMLLLSVVVALTMLFAALGSARLSLPILAALLLLATLHWACTAAERRRPRRIGMLFTTQVLLLAAMAQAMVLLVPPMWIAQMLWLIKRAVRA